MCLPIAGVVLVSTEDVFGSFLSASWLWFADLPQRLIAESPALLWVECFVVGIALELLFGDRNATPTARAYATNSRTA